MPQMTARKVRILIRELCQKALESAEGGDARAVAATALELYPQECNALLTTSLLDHLTRIARDVFKESETDPATDTPLLPGFPPHFYALLPRAVAIPRAKGRTMVYKALFGPHRATQDELKSGVTALRVQIGCDTARCDALEELWTYREYRGGDA